MSGPGPFVVASGDLVLNCTAGSGTVTVTANGTIVFSGNQTLAAGTMIRTAGGQVFTLVDALSAATTLNPITGSSPRYDSLNGPVRWTETAVAWTYSTEVESVPTTGINSAGEFTYYLDCNALAAGERVRIRVYKMVVTGGTSRLMLTRDVSGPADSRGTTQLDVYNRGRIAMLGPFVNVITDNMALRITVTQLNGTARTLKQSILNVNDGRANLTQILGTTLTETVGGYLAAAFKKLFDVVTPVFTAASVNQTGDSYAIVNSGTHGNAAIKGFVDDIGVAGAGLTAIPWNSSWDAEVQSEVQDAINASSLSTLTAAQVNAEVVDCLNVDTYAEPGQELPNPTMSLAKKIGYACKGVINKWDKTDSASKLYNNAGDTVDQKTTDVHSGGTFTRGKMVSGP